MTKVSKYHTVRFYEPCQNPFVTKVVRALRSKSMEVKHGLFHFLCLCDKVQVIKQHILTIFALFYSLVSILNFDPLPYF